MWLAGHPYGECPGRERCVHGVFTRMQSREGKGKEVFWRSQTIDDFLCG